MCALWFCCLHFFLCLQSPGMSLALCVLSSLQQSHLFSCFCVIHLRWKKKKSSWLVYLPACQLTRYDPPLLLLSFWVSVFEYLLLPYLSTSLSTCSPPSSRFFIFFIFLSKYFHTWLFGSCFSLYPFKKKKERKTRAMKTPTVMVSVIHSRAAVQVKWTLLYSVEMRH